jgi:hypothetical protein
MPRGFQHSGILYPFEACPEGTDCIVQSVLLSCEVCPEVTGCIVHPVCSCAASSATLETAHLGTRG